MTIQVKFYDSREKPREAAGAIMQRRAKRVQKENTAAHMMQICVGAKNEAAARTRSRSRALV